MDNARRLRSRHPGWFVCLGSALVLLAACAQASVATPEPTTLSIAGATTMQPVLRVLADEYSRRHPAVRFDLRGGGSTVGEERVAAGQVDLGASTLAATSPISPTGPTGAAETPSALGLVRIPIGLDGLAIIVHPTNVITDLSVLQLRDLFSGRIIDWAELNNGDGESGEILLVSREDGSGSRALFEERVMGDEPVSLTAVVMPTSADMVDYVAQNPLAIGYVSRAYAGVGLLGDVTNPDNRPDRRGAVTIIAVEGRLPTLENIQSQRYPLIQPLFLLSRGQPQGEAQGFIDFILSSPGQAIVGRYHGRVR